MAHLKSLLLTALAAFAASTCHAYADQPADRKCYPGIAFSAVSTRGPEIFVAVEIVRVLADGAWDKDGEYFALSRAQQNDVLAAGRAALEKKAQALNLSTPVKVGFALYPNCYPSRDIARKAVDNARVRWRTAIEVPGAWYTDRRVPAYQGLR